MAYDSLDTVVFKTAELRLDPLIYVAEMRATREFLHDYPGAAIDYRKMVAESLDQEIHRLTLSLNAHKGEPIVIDYPKTWWDAFKLHFANRWWLRVWKLAPADIVTHTIYPWMVLPDLKVPPGQRSVRWAEHVAPNYKAWHIEDDDRRTCERPTNRRP